MILGWATTKVEELERRCATLEMALCDLEEWRGASDLRNQRTEALIEAMEGRAIEAAVRLAEIAERLAALERARDDALSAAVTRDHVADALKPLTLQIAGISLQLATDGRQAQAAYLEILGRVERMANAAPGEPGVPIG